MNVQTPDIKIISEAAQKIEDGVSPEDFLKWAESLSDEQKKILVKATQNLPRVAPHPGPQSLAFNSEADVVGYGGAAGGGKAQPLDAKVLTPYGEREIGDLEIDDVICAPFGGTQRVTGHNPFRDWRAFRVLFDDGTSIDCSPEHEWFGVFDSELHFLQTRFDMIGGSVRGHETASIKKGIEEERKFFIPIADAADGDESMPLDIDPSIVAAWIMFGVAPINDHSEARIVAHESKDWILNRVSEKLGSSTILKKGAKASILIPNRIYERLTGVCDPFWREEIEYPFHRLSDTAMKAPKIWRSKLLRELLEMTAAKTSAPSSGQWQEWAAFHPFQEVVDDLVKLARGAGAWVHQGRNTSAVVRLPNDGDHPPILLKRIVGVEETGDYVDMRCISVSDSTGSYITDNGTITHNSALIGMLAYLNHSKSVVFRHDAKQLTNLIRDLKFFAGSEIGLNMQEEIFKFHGREDHFIEWGGIADERSLTKWRGREHDLFAVDEATEVPEHLVMTLMTWMRTSIPGQRCRAILTFNPPGAVDEATGIVPQGRWVIKYFAPWIDESYEERDLKKEEPLLLGKAKPGELRYFVTADDGITDKEVIGRGPHKIKIGDEIEEVYAQSRTFIPALFTDNPKLPKSYRDTLAKLKGQERLALMKGIFTSDIADSTYRVFPTQWVEEAQRRWTQEGRSKPICAIGCDVSRGGADLTCISARHEGLWFDNIFIPERKSANSVLIGDDVAKHCINRRRGWQDAKAIICIDANGIGASPFDSLIRLDGEERVRGVMFAHATKRILPGQTECANMRAFLYTLLRFLLEPKYGFEVALPPDDILKEEMCSVNYEPKDETSGKYQIEKKEKIRERIRRSPDRLDALVTSLYPIPDEPEPEWDRLMGYVTGNEAREEDRDEFMNPGAYDHATAHREGFVRNNPHAWMAQ